MLGNIRRLVYWLGFRPRPFTVLHSPSRHWIELAKIASKELAKGSEEGLRRRQAIMDSMDPASHKTFSQNVTTLNDAMNATEEYVRDANTIREMAEIMTGFHCPMCGSALEHIGIKFACTKDGMSFEIRIGTKNGHAEVIVRSL